MLLTDRYISLRISLRIELRAPFIWKWDVYANEFLLFWKLAFDDGESICDGLTHSCSKSIKQLDLSNYLNNGTELKYLKGVSVRVSSFNTITYTFKDYKGGPFPAMPCSLNTSSASYFGEKWICVLYHFPKLKFEFFLIEDTVLASPSHQQPRKWPSHPTILWCQHPITMTL